MPSSLDEPPRRPSRPRPQPARRRAASGTRSPQPRRRPQPQPRGRVVDEVEYDDDLVDEQEPPRLRSARPARTSRPTRSPRRRRAKMSPRKLVALLTALSVAVVALAVVAVALSARTSKPTPAAAPDNTPVPTTAFHDDKTGFDVSYPRSWKKIDVPVADYRLAVDGGSNVAFTIRVVPIETPATAANLENFKAVTDGLVGSNSSVKILKQQAVTLNGMLGYYYFYTFTDGGVTAVHAHYFLFSGYKMNVIVFQALPDDFTRMAPTFDQISESFRSDPNVPVAGTPVPTSTTTP